MKESGMYRFTSTWAWSRKEAALHCNELVYLIAFTGNMLLQRQMDSVVASILLAFWIDVGHALKMSSCQQSEVGLQS